MTCIVINFTSTSTWLHAAVNHDFCSNNVSWLLLIARYTLMLGAQNVKTIQIHVLWLSFLSTCSGDRNQIGT